MLGSKVAVLMLGSAVVGCAGDVVDARGGSGGSAPASTTTGPGEDPGPVDASFPDTHLECPGPSGACSSDDYPAGESCYACSCRCCSTPDEAACAADSACLAWLDCLRACEYGPPCARGCSLPCQIGTEPACYLADCHAWVCPHACG